MKNQFLFDLANDLEQWQISDIKAILKQNDANINYLFDKCDNNFRQIIEEHQYIQAEQARNELAHRETCEKLMRKIILNHETHVV